jgi:hypothetical protein
MILELLRRLFKQAIEPVPRCRLCPAIKLTRNLPPAIPEALLSVQYNQIFHYRPFLGVYALVKLIQPAIPTLTPSQDLVAVV